MLKLKSNLASDWVNRGLEEYFTPLERAQVAVHRDQYSGASVVDSFARFETKFIFPRNVEILFHNYLKQYLAPISFYPGSVVSDIESIYMDTQDLKFFRDHFSDLPIRHKLRFRRYGHAGIFLPDCFFEIKAKQNGIGRKERIWVSDEARRAVLQGGIVEHTKPLKKKNKQLGIRKLKRRLEFINALLVNLNLKPAVKVNYQRVAYQGEDVRVTVDSNLVSESLMMVLPETAQGFSRDEPLRPIMDSIGSFSNEASFVVEIKHGGEIPLWFSEFTDSIGVGRGRFSKYCWGLIPKIKSSAEYKV